MFRYFPKAPLGTVVWILRMDRVPSKSEFDMILLTIRNRQVSDLSQELDDLTVSENTKDTSEVKPSSDEMRLKAKRKKYLSVDREKAEKRRKENEQEDSDSTGQAELSSLTCRKFENLTIDENLTIFATLTQF